MILIDKKKEGGVEWISGYFWAKAAERLNWFVIWCEYMAVWESWKIWIEKFDLIRGFVKQKVSKEAVESS